METGVKILFGLALISIIIIVISLKKICFLQHNSITQKNLKILMIIAPKDFRDEEVFIPKKIFENMGYKVEIVSLKTGNLTGMLGGKIFVNKTVDDIKNIEKYDGLVIPGGIGSKKYLWNNVKVINLVKRFYHENKTIGAICLSPVVLANAGILNGRKATVFPDPEAIKILKERGAIYVDEPVVIDSTKESTIVTAKDPKYAEEFGKKYVEIIINKQ